MRSPLRQALIHILQDKAYKQLPEPVQLASGQWSRDFVDGKEGLSRWSDLHLACQAIVETVHAAGHQFDAVGGLTLGADALAIGIAAVADGRWFFVRKEAKERGTGRMVEGYQIGAGDRVLLVDDAVTSGGSILKAYRVCLDRGATVVAAVTLIDRGDVAAKRFADVGVDYFPMATYADLGIEPVEFGSVSTESTG